jgi:hypothetical protein
MAPTLFEECGSLHLNCTALRIAWQLPATLACLPCPHSEREESLCWSMLICWLCVLLGVICATVVCSTAAC